jgi:hypothetical protein
VEADHFATPDVAAHDLVRWLDRVAAAKATN